MPMFRGACRMGRRVISRAPPAMTDAVRNLYYHALRAGLNHRARSLIANSSSRSTTRSACDLSCFAGKVVVTATHFIPARRAASRPKSASSKTTQCPGLAPRRSAARRKISGAGLPNWTFSALTIVRKNPAHPIKSREKSILARAVELPMPQGMPASARRSSQVTTPGSGLTPLHAPRRDRVVPFAPRDMRSRGDRSSSAGFRE